MVGTFSNFLNKISVKNIKNISKQSINNKLIKLINSEILVSGESILVCSKTMTVHLVEGETIVRNIT